MQFSGNPADWMVLPYSSKQFNQSSRKKSADFLFNFTQTKTPQTCTKQTSMYSFFSPSGKKKIAQIQDKSKAANVPEILNQTWTAIPSCAHRSGSPISIKSPCNEEGSECSDSCNFLMDKGKQAGSEQDENWVPEKYHPQISVSEANSFFKVHKEFEKSRPFALVGSTSFDSHSLSSLPCSEEDSNKGQDSLSQSRSTSQLFTEDSEGNIVINHWPVNDKKRKCHLSLPLRDKTNLTCDSSSPASVCQSSSQENSMQMIFTQDSEGNVVIKH
uniref:Uncharacterized protein n=1 Tax=Leptobrachium leishanense TaxID=445787 RepID=A0A8C5M0V7_9ANUR